MTERKRLWVPEAPHLMLNRTQRIGALDMPAPGIEGWYELELVHKRTGLIAQRTRFRNVITDQGLNDLAAYALSTLTSYVAVGTGSREPSVVTPALEAEVARTNASGTFAVENAWAANNEYCYYRVTRVFSQAQANANLAEIGCGRQATGPLFSAQLIKDANGNPTSIPKTSEYELRVVYEVRIYPPIDDVTISVPFNGVNRDLTVRPGALGSPGNNFWLQSAFGGMPSTNGTSESTGHLSVSDLVDRTLRPSQNVSLYKNSGVNTPYVAGSYYVEQTMTWDAARANSLMKTFVWNGVGALFQISLGAAGLIKNNTQKHEIVARAHWARHNP